MPLARVAWLGLAFIAGCNALWGIDELSYRDRAQLGGAGGGGSGGASGSSGSTSSGSSGDTSSSGSSGSGSGGSGGTTLPCDPGFAFTTEPAIVGTPFQATFTDNTPYVYVDLEVSGAGSPQSSWVGVTGNGPWHWTYNIGGHGAGVLYFTFVRDKEGANPGVTVANCQLYSVP